MKNEFPLFSHLKNEVACSDTPLTPVEVVSLIENIKEMDEQGCTLVYALIRYYQIYEDNDNVVNSPYGMKKVKNGYRFCVEDFPPLLQNLLKRFVEIHLESKAIHS